MRNGDVVFADEDGVPPLELWANVRLFTLIEGWLMMDTVGHPQLNAPGKPPFPDIEAVFPKGKCDPQDVDAFLRNLALYLLANGAETIKDGDTMLCMVPESGRFAVSFMHLTAVSSDTRR